MDNAAIAKILNEIGLLLELKGENPFKAGAYYGAARKLERMTGDAAGMVREGSLSELPGIGKALEEKITELVETGRLEYYDKLKVSVPAGIFDILKIPGIGPKKTKVLYDELEIDSLRALEYACRENRLVDLEGFGQKSQENILKGIAFAKRNMNRYLYSEGVEAAEALLRELKNCPHVMSAEKAGSIRRRKETIKDIDLVAATDKPEETTEFFGSLDTVEEITASGKTKVGGRLKGGIGVDLRMVEPERFPFALHHFTGSKEHNTALRGKARSMNMKINEYGILREDRSLSCDSEEDIFALFDMDYIPPELRENTGELEAALNGELPVPLREDDIKGVFHVHTVASDGGMTLEEAAESCRFRGWEYMGIAEHSKSAAYAGGLDEDRLKRQAGEIDEFNDGKEGFRVFKGIEVDILPDGALDLGDETLSILDFVIASVHGGFKMDEKSMTGRILRAMDNPHVTMLGHPTGRLLLARDAYAVDMEAVLEKAEEKNVILELNAHPQRLDLDWINCRKARSRGIKVSVNPDAHHEDGFDNVKYGIYTARRGWLEKDDILNTMGLNEMTAFLKGHRK